MDGAWGDSGVINLYFKWKRINILQGHQFHYQGTNLPFRDQRAI